MDATSEHRLRRRHRNSLGTVHSDMSEVMLAMRRTEFVNFLIDFYASTHMTEEP